MSPDRFNECLLHIRWTPINLASALQWDLSWIEALETGNAEVPAGLATWLETLAQPHFSPATNHLPAPGVKTLTTTAGSRFDIRKDSDSRWEIFDTTTGRTVFIGGKPYFDLPQDSADTLADFMNSVGMVPDKDTLH
jgi:hypothetical protein